MTDLFTLFPPSEPPHTAAHTVYSNPAPGVRDTSREAYKEHKETGKLNEQHRTILYFLGFKPEGYTRNELAQSTTLRLSSVCGRVNELIERGILQDLPRRKCTVTGRSSHVVSVISKP